MTQCGMSQKRKNSGPHVTVGEVGFTYELCQQRVFLRTPLGVYFNVSASTLWAISLQVIINSTITPNMTFTKTSQKFGQWADSRANTVFGLGFSSEQQLTKVTRWSSPQHHECRCPMCSCLSGDPALPLVSRFLWPSASPLVALQGCQTR